MIKPFSYKVRPGYGSDNLLIEFGRTGEIKPFILKLRELLEADGFIFGDTQDIWMNDEVWIELISSNGKSMITVDVWDFVFILADNNQEDIERIDKVLLKSNLFEKEEVDFSEYK